MALHRIDEDLANVALAALIAWAALVGGATVEGVFGKFDARSIAVFAVAVALYAFLAYRMDRGMHGFIQELPRLALCAAAGSSLMILAAGVFGHVPALAVFAAPLAAVACAAAVEKLLAKPRKGRAKSPAGSRAAI